MVTVDVVSLFLSVYVIIIILDEEIMDLRGSGGYRRIWKGKKGLEMMEIQHEILKKSFKKQVNNF